MGGHFKGQMKGISMEKEIIYHSTLSSEQIKTVLADQITKYNKTHNAGFILDPFEKDNICIGIERGGHSGGYWYKAEVVDTPNGSDIIGKITYIGSNAGKEERSLFGKIKDGILIGLGVIILFIPLVIVSIIKLVFLLYCKLLKKPTTKEARLDVFMASYLQCHKDDAK